VTRIASFDGLSTSGPPGFSTRRSSGHLPAGPLTSEFGSGRGLFRSGPAAPWSLALAALGLAAAAAWRSGSNRGGAAGIGPAALHLHCTPARPPKATESVSVLIAVRHEPGPAIAAVRAALCQLGVNHLDVVVLDDGCPQETRAALRCEFGDDPRVRILAAAPLPRGWSPLAHRSHQLAVAARGRVLIFAEPSAPLGPHAAASATALLRGEQLDLAVLDTGRPAHAHVDAHARSEGKARGQGQGRGRGPSQGQEQGRGESVVAGGMQARGVDGARKAAARSQAGRSHSARVHPGRFAVAVDAEAYWRIGGYRAAASDPDPLALLRTVRRASGRTAVADGRRVIPPAQTLTQLPPPDPRAEAEWDSLHSSRGSLTGTARRVFAALVGARP
jgi:hypothetical protein